MFACKLLYWGRVLVALRIVVPKSGSYCVIDDYSDVTAGAEAHCSCARCRTVLVQVPSRVAELASLADVILACDAVRLLRRSPSH